MAEASFETVTWLGFALNPNGVCLQERELLEGIQLGILYDILDIKHFTNP